MQSKMKFIPPEGAMQFEVLRRYEGPLIGNDGGVLWVVPHKRRNYPVSCNHRVFRVVDCSGLSEKHRKKNRREMKRTCVCVCECIGRLIE